MKLKDALQLAVDLDLTTVEEAMLNVHIHAMSMFAYDSISDELDEMEEEYKKFRKIFYFNKKSNCIRVIRRINQYENNKANS